jgi:hypothetical protein
VYSRERGLFTLILFTDVTSADAPTRIRVGSHRDAATALLPAGIDGLAHSRPVAEASAHRPIEYATGRRGHVFLLPVLGAQRVVASPGPDPAHDGAPDDIDVRAVRARRSAHWAGRSNHR